MDLTHYSLEDCLLAALKGEIDSEVVYTRLADFVENAFLKDRLLFLAEEEKKHQKVFSSWYTQEFPERELVVPEQSPVPLPALVITGERMALSKVLEQAMKAEEIARDFYRQIAEHFSFHDQRKKALLYIAAMENSHYKILEGEMENLEELESYHIEWPMMHVGP